MKGYTQKILRINLTNKEINEITPDVEIYKNFLGGSGLAAKIFLDNYSFSGDLFSNNILIFATGPLTGTRLPGCSTRFSVCARSPLTNIWGRDLPAAEVLE
jgi:aldehyde:ferredoxin oxidoreductase